MFSIYILYSKALDRFYVGTTDDATLRLGQHNDRFYPNAYTTKGIPLEL